MAGLFHRPRVSDAQPPIATDRAANFRRLASLALVTIPTFFLSPQTLIQIFVVLGHAHFALTYLYQARAGKWQWSHAVFLLAAFAYLFALGNWFPRGFEWWVATFFTLHFMQDERHLEQRPPAYLPAQLLTFALTLTMAGLAGETLFHYVIAWPCLGIGAIFAITAWITAYRSRNIAPIVPYGSAIIIASMLFYALGVHDLALRLFFFIILSHYLHWYLALFLRFQQEGGNKLERYGKDIALAHALFGGGLVWAYTTLPAADFLQTYLYNYSPTFLAWTCLHLIATLRREDYRWIIKQQEHA